MSSEFIRGPKWRTRADPKRRHLAASVTFGVILAFGAAATWACIGLLGALGAPGWIAAMPWIVPTVGTVVWTLVRPRIAGLTDDDDDSWFGYSIRWVLVGELEPRSAPARVVAAVLFGAPVAWALLVLGLLTIIGLV